MGTKIENGGSHEGPKRMKAKKLWGEAEKIQLDAIAHTWNFHTLNLRRRYIQVLDFAPGVIKNLYSA